MNNKLTNNQEFVGSIISSFSEDSDIFSKEYLNMVKNIQTTLPLANVSASNFYKTHSQFHNGFLDINEITPINSLKHILARIERKKAALSEAYFKRKKSQIEIRQKQKKLESLTDEFERELLQLEVDELICGITEGDNYIKGAIRELSYLMTQYKNVTEKIGKEYITEEDYEKDEIRYHIMTAFKQALISSRPRNGIVDEGNTIYFFDLGINAAAAQSQIFKYLQKENELLQKGEYPSHEMTLDWLEECANLFQDSVFKYAQRKGFVVLDQKSLNQI
jgi:hypothetical protein